MFLFYLIFLLFLKQTDARNITVIRLEELAPLSTNNELETIAAQFNQNPNWELGNMPLTLTEEEEITPNDPDAPEISDKPGLIKTGHLFQPEDMHPYRIDRKGVHPHTEHHIFFVRHGLYYYTEVDSSSHLLRYGKYQARMAGDKINEIIHNILSRSGPLTRPIKLVSSTQTRAYETLYNIRLQLSNNFEYAPEIIQDTGLTECVDTNRQRFRWLYFVREYLQPIKSTKREHTITIIASHGNLLTTFDYIISHFLSQNIPMEAFPTFRLPLGTGMKHAEVSLYRTIGAERVHFRESYSMIQIPITVNHAHLKRDFYYEWASVHKCRSQYGRENMKNYIRAGILDNVFGGGPFSNKMRDYDSIVYWEMLQEYDTHILPMLMHTCRTYLYRLPFIQANTDFGSFHRSMSPVPIPETEQEQRSPLQKPMDRFNAYSMPFFVDNAIQKFRKNPALYREQIPPGVVHPQSRDDSTSYLTRLGINQIRGVVDQIHRTIHDYMHRLQANVRILPINIVAEPSIPAAESCFHVRNLLLSVDYSVSEQVTDLGIQFNYFHKRSAKEFMDFQRVQVLYLLRRYLGPDQNDSSRPSFQVHILCGDGRLFSAFRQELVIAKIPVEPVPRFASISDPGYNALKHANAFFFEAIDRDVLRLHETITLTGARQISEEQRMVTDHSLLLPSRELKNWLRNPSGPCTLSYFLDNTEQLVQSVANTASVYHQQLAFLLKREWHPYLAGLFIYACRLHLTLSDTTNIQEIQPAAAAAAAAAAGENEATNRCDIPGTAAAAASGGPSGDCP
ncbi:unnamed protein product [Adineta steineri]|uniref:Uncharacterized protein n=1 Tax=Adineta steineri TaxID=433720 RepID=A0A814XSG5_9BILA|nr:unnamed protein product [Adineta steineri]CAF3694272.1 unnamed protein product [Adineta steineri]